MSVLDVVLHVADNLGQPEKEMGILAVNIIGQSNESRTLWTLSPATKYVHFFTQSFSYCSFYDIWHSELTACYDDLKVENLNPATKSSRILSGNVIDVKCCNILGKHLQASHYRVAGNLCQIVIP